MCRVKIHQESCDLPPRSLSWTQNKTLEYSYTFFKCVCESFAADFLNIYSSISVRLSQSDRNPRLFLSGDPDSGCFWSLNAFVYSTRRSSNKVEVHPTGRPEPGVQPCIHLRMWIKGRRLYSRAILLFFYFFFLLCMQTQRGPVSRDRRPIVVADYRCAYKPAGTERGERFQGCFGVRCRGSHRPMGELLLKRLVT